MRFTAVIMHRNACLARVSCDPTEGETIQETAFRARASLIRDVMRYSLPEVLDGGVLAEIAEAYRDVVASQLLTGESRDVTCVTRGSRTFRMEGMVATITGPTDVICLIQAHDDAWVSGRRDFVDGLLGRASAE